MSVRQTPVSYLNAQVAQIPTLSTNVGNLTNTTNYISSGYGAVSTAAGGATSSATYAVDTVSSLLASYVPMSTNTSSQIARLNLLSSLIGDTYGTTSTYANGFLALSSSVSTLTSSVTVALVGAVGYQAFSTSFYAPVVGFSTVYGSNFTRLNGTSTLVTTLSSIIYPISTSYSNVSTQLTGISTTVSTNTSSIIALSTSIGNLPALTSAISTQVVQYGARPLQAFNGVYTDSDWYNGTNTGKTSTIMRFQAGLTADGSGTAGDSNSVSIINNSNSSTTMLPLMIGISGSNIPDYPNAANQILRFAHSGVPGSNSSIVINLVTGGTASNAIEMNAGEVLTMVYAGGGNTNPANYYYFPTL